MGCLADLSSFFWLFRNGYRYLSSPLPACEKNRVRGILQEKFAKWTAYPLALSFVAVTVDGSSFHLRAKTPPSFPLIPIAVKSMKEIRTIWLMNQNSWMETRLSRIKIWSRTSHMMREVLKSPLLRRCIKSGRYQKEVPFSYKDNGTIFEGVMDVVLKEGDGLTVLDFKTDKVGRDDLSPRI